MTPSTAFDQIHLSWAECTSTTLTVTWHAPKALACGVRYRLPGAGEWLYAPGDVVPTDSKGVIYRTTLRGLAPAAAYEYHISTAPNQQPAQQSAIFVGRTAPQGHADLRFGFLTDTGLIGRPDGNTTGTAQVLAEIAREQPLFLLGAGDYAYGNRDGRYEVMADAVDAWFNQVQDLLANMPFMPQYGNHEIHLRERYEDWAPRFAHADGPEDGRYYSFDVADIHFTALFVPHGEISEAQGAWLDEDLTKARARNPRWLIVYQHDSIYGHGTSHPANPKVRAAVAPLMEKHGVDLHLSAHDQNYERTYPLAGVPDQVTVCNHDLHRYAKGNGVIYAKISPCGKMSEIGNKFSTFTEPQQPFMAVRDDTAHHYAMVDVSASGELAVTVYSVVGDGSPKVLLDHFVIGIN